MAALRGEVRADIAEVRTDLAAQRAETRADLAALEVRLVRWAIGSGLATAALTVATVGLLFRLLG